MFFLRLSRRGCVHRLSSKRRKQSRTFEIPPAPRARDLALALGDRRRLGTARNAGPPSQTARAPPVPRRTPGPRTFGRPPTVPRADPPRAPRALATRVARRAATAAPARDARATPRATWSPARPGGVGRRPRGGGDAARRPLPPPRAGRGAPRRTRRSRGARATATRPGPDPARRRDRALPAPTHPRRRHPQRPSRTHAPGRSPARSPARPRRVLPPRTPPPPSRALGLTLPRPHLVPHSPLPPPLPSLPPPPERRGAAGRGSPRGHRREESSLPAPSAPRRASGGAFDESDAPGAAASYMNGSVPAPGGARSARLPRGVPRGARAGRIGFFRRGRAPRRAAPRRRRPVPGFAPAPVPRARACASSSTAR